MDISFSTRHKAADTPLQQASTSTPSRPKSILDLPLETVALIGASLSPTDLVSMVSVCRQWRPLKDVLSVTRRVAAGGRLRPPPLYGFSRPMMIPSADPWSDILFEARLLRRLDRGPVEIGPRSHYSAVELSPNMQHLQLQSQSGEQIIRHLDSYGRENVFFPTHEISHFLKFTEQGNALMGASSRHGPIQSFDLTAHKRPPRTIAPYARYDYRSAIAPADGKSYIFSCSDGHLRTFTKDSKGFFNLSCDFDLGRPVDLFAVSGNGNILLAAASDDENSEDEDDYGYNLYSFDSKDFWKKIGEIETSTCCAEFTLSPLGRFLMAVGCDGSEFYSIDATAVAPRQTVHECESYGCGILSADETKTAVSKNNKIIILQWPDFKEISSYSNDRHHDLEWLKPYKEWLKRRLCVSRHISQGEVWNIQAAPQYSAWDTLLA